MTVSSQIIEVLNYLCQKFGIVIDWTQETILPYVQGLMEKYISWEIATSWMWIVVAGVAVLIGLILIITDSVFGWGYGVGIFAGICMIAIGIIMAICQVIDIITCIHFPEKQIIEYIHSYMQWHGN